MTDPVAQAALALVSQLVGINGPFQLCNQSPYNVKGDRVDLTNVSMSIGTNVMTGVGTNWQPTDIGKTIMLAGAGAGGFQLITTITGWTSATSITTAAVAVATVTSQPCCYATDDRAALQSFLNACAASGCVAYIPATMKIMMTGSGVYYSSGAHIQVRGQLGLFDAWGNGYVLSDYNMNQGLYVGGAGNSGLPTGPYTTDVTIDMAGGGIFASPAWTGNTGGLQKKGVGITFTNRARFIAGGINSAAVNQNSFYTEIRMSTKVNAWGGMVFGGIGTANQGATYTGTPNGLGQDGIHVDGNSSDILVYGFILHSGDDASSVTNEGPGSVNSVTSNVTFAHCGLFPQGAFSGCKITTTTLAGAATVQKIKWIGCYVRCDSATGGAPVVVTNPGYSNGCVVDDIQFIGCTFDFGTNSATVGANTQVSHATNVKFIDCLWIGSTAGGQVILGQNCDGLTIKGEINMTCAQNVIASGLTVTACAYTGSDTTYTVTGTVTGIAAGHWLYVTGCANPINNGCFQVNATGVVGQVIHVSNLRRGNTTLNEASVVGAPATTTAYAAQTSPVVLQDVNNVDIDLAVRGTGWVAPGTVQVTYSSGNIGTTANKNGRVRLSLRNQIGGSGLTLQNCSNYDVQMDAWNCTGDYLWQDQGGTNSGYNHIHDCHDFGGTQVRLLAAANGYSLCGRTTTTNSVAPVGTSHKNNVGFNTDKLTGTTSIASGATTNSTTQINLNSQYYINDENTITAADIQLVNTTNIATPMPAVTIAAGLVTLTAAVAPTSTTTWAYKVEPSFV